MAAETIMHRCSIAQMLTYVNENGNMEFVHHVSSVFAEVYACATAMGRGNWKYGISIFKCVDEGETDGEVVILIYLNPPVSSTERQTKQTPTQQMERGIVISLESGRLTRIIHTGDHTSNKEESDD